MAPSDLRARRLALGLSRDELAAVAGVSRWTLRALESGTRRGKQATWRRLEAALRLLAVDRSIEADQVIEDLA